MYFKIWGVKGFDINFLDDSYFQEKLPLSRTEFSNCRLEFYHDKKKIKSCQDFIDWNRTQIESVFQISRFEDFGTCIQLMSLEFKDYICPLVFKNAFISYFLLNDIV
jgi:hypothetical protein